MGCRMCISLRKQAFGIIIFQNVDNLIELADAGIHTYFSYGIRECGIRGNAGHA